MTEAQRAAFRILCSTPRERVHTHSARPFAERKQGARVGRIPDELVAEVKALQLQGLCQRDILQRLTMGDKLYRRINRILDERTSVEERRQQIRHLLRIGTTERRIAAIVGLSRTTIQKHKRKIETEDARAADSRYANIPVL